MKIAIVGSSHLSENEEHEARKTCGIILNDTIKREGGPENVIFVSGGAKGVDSIGEEAAKSLDLSLEIYHPTEQNWNAFKIRNIRIAQECDVIYSLPTKFKNEACYHCNDPTHEKSGACWTLKYAASLKDKKRECHVLPL